MSESTTQPENDRRGLSYDYQITPGGRQLQGTEDVIPLPEDMEEVLEGEHCIMCRAYEEGSQLFSEYSDVVCSEPEVSIANVEGMPIYQFKRSRTRSYQGRQRSRTRSYPLATYYI